MSKVTFVVPARNEEAGIADLFAALCEVSEQLKLQGHELEVISVDNHSADQTYELLKRMSSSAPFEVKIYPLNRNYGLQRSILFGLSKATGDAAIVFQSDLQDPIEAALRMVKEWEKGAKVVAGISNERVEKRIVLLTSGIFYWVINLFTDVRLLRWFQDFFLLDRTVYQDLARRINHYEFLRGRLVDEYGVNGTIEYRRLGRKTGESKFNFAARYSVALDGITRFGTKLIRKFVIFGTLTFGLSSVIFIGSLVSLLFTSERYFGSILTWLVILLLGLVIAALGLILEYLIRILGLTSNTSTEIYTLE